MMMSSVILAAVAFLQGPIPEGPDPQQEIKKLFQEIEKDLKEIDELLLNASSTPDSAASGMEAAVKKLGELLRKAQSDMDNVGKSIDEILRKIPPGGSGSSLGSQDQGQPKDQKNQQQGERKREPTPEDPGQLPKGKNKPEGGQDTQDPGQNRTGPPPQKPPGDPVKNSQEGGKWGELPDMVQGLFRNLNTEEIPVRYRRWIDNYYKTMNTSKP